jgi:hypothetical protein
MSGTYIADAITTPAREGVRGLVREVNRVTDDRILL